MLCMNKSQAETLAADISKAEHTYAKIGRHTTNGQDRYVVHVTHDVDGREPVRPYTISH